MHRAVVIAAQGRLIDEELEVDHYPDADVSNCRIENLRTVTKWSNLEHRNQRNGYAEYADVPF